MTGIGSSLEVVRDIIRDFVADAYEAGQNPLPLLRSVYPQVAFRFSRRLSHFELPPSGAVWINVTPSSVDETAAGADVVVLLHAQNISRAID